MAVKSFTQPVSHTQKKEGRRVDVQLPHPKSGLIVLERNYLDVYPYDKWNDNELPNFAEDDVYPPLEVELRDGETTRPNLLTEADLVSLMDKNGIGCFLFFLLVLAPIL